MLAYGRAAAVDALGGRSEQAIEWANKGIELAREIGFENITRPLGMRGVARLDLGDRGGLDDLRADLELCLRLGLPAEDTALAYSNVGEMVGLENLAQGRELIEAGLELHAVAVTPKTCWCRAHTSSGTSSTRAAGTSFSRRRMR